MNVDKSVMEILKLRSYSSGSGEFDKWIDLVKKADSAKYAITIGMTGKYTEVHDSYMSILKALEHSAPYLSNTATQN